MKKSMLLFALAVLSVAAASPVLMAAPAPGPVGGLNVVVSGMDVDKVIFNINGSTSLGVYDGSLYWECQAVVDMGDRVNIRVLGAADGGAVSVTATNMMINSAMCRDKGNRERAAASIGGETCDCGLAPDAGSKVVVRISGIIGGDNPPPDAN